MAIYNTRHQLPVGQGFFHAGWIRFTEVEDGTWARAPETEPGFFYVYDCGAMSKYATARDREIAKLVALVGRRARLDLLVISHMHADHVNGVKKLVTDGELEVDTIMMPMVEMKERCRPRYRRENRPRHFNACQEALDDRQEARVKAVRP